MDVPLTPRLRVFAGPNGSGKTTMYALLLQEKAFQPLHYVNPDDLQKQLLDRVPVRFPFSNAVPIQDLLRKTSYYSASGGRNPAELLCIEGDLISGVRLVSSDTTGGYLAAALGEAIRTAGVESKHSIGFETVFSDSRKLLEIDHARNNGYRTYLYFVTTGDPEVNISRVRNRVIQGGHDVPDEKLRSRYERSMELLPSAIEHFDRVFIYDTFENYKEAALLVKVSPREDNPIEMQNGDKELPNWAKQVLDSFHIRRNAQLGLASDQVSAQDTQTGIVTDSMGAQERSSKNLLSGRNQKGGGGIGD